MFNFSLFIILFFLFEVKASCQSVFCDSTSNKKGTVKIYSNPEWKSLAFPPAEVEISDEPKLQGYRVQVFSGSHRNDANQVKVQVLQSLPDLPVYFLYEAPYFKVRVGDFRNKLEAQKVLHELKI